MPDNSSILFLTSWYPVPENPVHGIFIRNHAVALSPQTNVVVAYAYSSRTGPYYEIDENKVNEHLTEYRIKYPKPITSVIGIKTFVQTLKYKKAYKLLLGKLIEKKIKVKAIQVNIVFPVSIVLSLFKKHYKVPHTIAENWSGYLASDGNYHGKVMKHFTEKCFADTSKIWHVSELQKQALIGHGLTGNFELLYNTVNTEVFTLRPFDGAHGKQAQGVDVRLLHVSSLVEREKNITGTFRVLKKLNDKNYKFTLDIIGGSEETIADAKAYANSLGLKNITFLGPLPPEKIAEHMRKSTALVLFSHYEGMPVVALEALSCGLPVIATKVGQLPHIITDQMGHLVETDNEAEMLAALENLFLNKYRFDPQTMREFILKNASYESVGKQFWEFYSKI